MSGERVADEVAEARVGDDGAAARRRLAVAEGTGADERHGLRLVLERRDQVLALVHDVVALGAHAARAVDVRAPGSQTHMRTLPESQLGFWGTLEAPTPMPAVSQSPEPRSQMPTPAHSAYVWMLPVLSGPADQATWPEQEFGQAACAVVAARARMASFMVVVGQMK